MHRVARTAGVWLLAAAGLTLAPAVWADPAPARLTAAELAARERDVGNDPVGLLLLSRLADEAAARRLRRKVFMVLDGQRQSATPAELDALAARLARRLPEAAHTPADVKEVLGKPTQVARQVLYRRYLEQWTYDSPVRLCVVFDCVKGQDLSLRAAFPLPPARP
jgi:hypothetical protein